MTQSRSKQEVESMKQKQLKGFTLVELVVVMAIFSMIMFGAMQLMDPVSKIFSAPATMKPVPLRLTT